MTETLVWIAVRGEYRCPEQVPNYVSRRRTEVQASSSWTPPSGTLGGIVAEARARATELEGRAAELERFASDSSAPSLIAALRRPNVAVIAEVKRRSPSKGWIQASLSAAAQASSYLDGGASAISVLTEPRHFA